MDTPLDTTARPAARHSACPPHRAVAQSRGRRSRTREPSSTRRAAIYWGSSHQLCCLRNFGWKGSLFGETAASSMEARSHEHASDRPERAPPRASSPRGSDFAGDSPQPPRGPDNVPGCRSVTSAGRPPTRGFPAARGTDGSCRVLRDRRRPGIDGSPASGGMTRLGPTNLVGTTADMAVGLSSGRGWSRRLGGRRRGGGRWAGTPGSVSALPV